MTRIGSIVPPTAAASAQILIRPAISSIVWVGGCRDTTAPIPPIRAPPNTIPKATKKSITALVRKVLILVNAPFSRIQSCTIVWAYFSHI
ncbi:hypothetical protein D3C81_1016200 [compost metagenome]